jgi:hypothetical protein
MSKTKDNLIDLLNIENLKRKQLGEECGLTFVGYDDETSLPDFIGNRKQWDEYDKLLTNGNFQ